MNFKEKRKLATLDIISLVLITTEIVFTVLIASFSSNKGMIQLFVYLSIICSFVGIKTIKELKQELR